MTCRHCHQDDDAGEPCCVWSLDDEADLAALDAVGPIDSDAQDDRLYAVARAVGIVDDDEAARFKSYRDKAHAAYAARREARR